MNFQIYRPSASLHPYVKQYYSWQDDNHGTSSIPQNLISLGDQYLLFIHKGTVTCKPKNHSAFTLPYASVIGHFNCASQLKVSGPVDITVIQLNAYGAYRLIGLCMHTLTNYYRDLYKLQQPAWETLGRTLQDGIQQSLLGNILDNALTAILDTPRPLQQIDVITEFLLKQNGNTGIDYLSRRFDISRPTLERRFMEVVGLPPTLYTRMLRFKAAMRNLQQVSFPQWTAFLQNNGYYNEAVFIKDYLYFNGQSPSFFEPAINTTITAMLPHTDMHVAAAG
ncbi:helix-turn-helix domain-containing protein [Chitinophaga pendula]|uniref:helix-turn-helix domain-containing protein n=1 Tax=Chitinophaga TaxID=79328 RepID=UPI0012FDCA6E|nr:MULTISPECIES: helix-turn-helix domain-containing protein [Chitinophaga]UCJ05185.1 helix-turn-helix domain-containing protein [Chitinophaga pendula]